MIMSKHFAKFSEMSEAHSSAKHDEYHQLIFVQPEIIFIFQFSIYLAWIWYDSMITNDAGDADDDDEIEMWWKN